MKTMTAPKFFKIVFGLYVGLAFLGAAFNALTGRSSSQDYDCIQETTSPRAVIDSSIDVQNLWSMKIRMLNFRIPETAMVINNDLLILADSACKQVVAFDLLKGEKVWDRDIVGYSITNDPIRDNRIYVTEISGSDRQLWALRASTGQTIWINNHLKNQRTGLSISIEPNGDIYFYAGATNWSYNIYSLDAATGDIETELEMPERAMLYSEGRFWREFGTGIASFDAGNFQMLWDWNTNVTLGAVMIRPNFVENYLLVQKGGEVSRLYVLDKSDGELLWDLGETVLVSNVVESEGVVYALTHTARLLILNLATGELIHEIQFTIPEVTDYEEHLLTGPGLIGSSWLAVSENIVAVYFQDTETLSVMEIEP